MVDYCALLDWGILPVVRPASQPQVIQVADFEADPHAGELYRDGRKIKQMYAESVAELEKTKPFQEDRVYIRQTAYLHARMGKRVEARRELATSLELSQGKDVSLGAVALVYAALGDREKTFSWLGKAYTAKSTFMTTLKFWSVFDPIRSDARFTDLVRRVGLNN